ncbi:DUF5908 family protein [Aquimarina longa]|uniref:DUF5908 family protein n=1 Tax=Aquimarina longa TaxID=1080221 RepID=UPI000B0CD616|nr:DUF5908 family protein [Aquimarina longa]
MPLEIRELIIKTTVNNESKKIVADNATTSKMGVSQINEIAEKIFEIIKEKSER